LNGSIGIEKLLPIAKRTISIARTGRPYSFFLDLKINKMQDEAESVNIEGTYSYISEEGHFRIVIDKNTLAVKEYEVH
jgi:hypothetical protein